MHGPELPLENGPFVLFGTIDVRKFTGIGKFFLQLTHNVTKGYRLGSKNDRSALLLNNHLSPLKAKSLRQAHRLTSSVLKKLGRCHIYTMYLYLS